MPWHHGADDVQLVSLSENFQQFRSYFFSPIPSYIYIWSIFNSYVKLPEGNNHYNYCKYVEQQNGNHDHWLPFCALLVVVAPRKKVGVCFQRTSFSPDGRRDLWGPLLALSRFRVDELQDSMLSLGKSICNNKRRWAFLGVKEVRSHLETPRCIFRQPSPFSYFCWFNYGKRVLWEF